MQKAYFHTAPPPVCTPYITQNLLNPTPFSVQIWIDPKCHVKAMHLPYSGVVTNWQGSQQLFPFSGKLSSGYKADRKVGLAAALSHIF